MNKKSPTLAVSFALLLNSVAVGSGALAQDAGDFGSPMPITPIAGGIGSPTSLPSASAGVDTPRALTPLAQEILQQANGGPGPGRSKSGTTMREIRPNNVKEFKEYLDASKTPESMEHADKLIKSGDQFFKKGNFHEALLRWQEAYGLAIEMKYSAGQGKALVGMCKVYLTQGKWVKARHLGENAVEVLAAINDQVELGKARVALAQAYFGLDNPMWAVRQLDLAMQHLISHSDSEPLEAAKLMRLAGALAIRFNKLQESIRYFQESAKYSAQGDDLPGALSMHCKITALLTELGFYVAAKEEAQKAMVLAERADNDRARISALSSLANAKYVLGEYREANIDYKRAYELGGKLDEKYLPKDGKANILMGYAFSLIAVGQEKQAEPMIKSIIPFFQRGGKYYAHAECLNALGMMHVHRGEDFKAVPYFEEALDVQSMIKPSRANMQIMILTNIAGAKFRVGKYRDAYNHLRAMIPILNRDKNGHMLDRTHTYLSLAEVAMKMADTETAEKYLTSAIKLGKEYCDDASLWRSLTLQAQIELARKESDDAKETLIDALSHFRSPQAGIFPSAEFIRFMTSRREFGQNLVTLLASQGMAEKALLAAEQIKEEEFIVSWLKEGGQVKPEHQDVFTDLIQQRAHLHAAEASTTPDKLAKEWEGWLTRFTTLARQNKPLARLITPYPTSVEEIISTCRERKITLVDYFVGDKSSVAFTVDPAGRISATVLPTGHDKLSGQVSAILASTSGAGQQATPGAERPILKSLYNELLPPPVREFLPITADRHIVIIPDGVLFNLPFAALIDENDKYVIEEHLISLAPNVRELFDENPSTSTQFSVLVAGNKDPFELSVANQISSVLSPQPVTTIATGASDLGQLEKEARGKAVLHLASSMSLNDSDPIEAKIPFSTSNASGNGQQPTGSSVARDLFEMSIPNDLVVFSGSSVSGAVNEGKAMRTFSRGLKYAGARNVMISLWNRPDNGRLSELVTFYKSKKAGLSDAQSLRQAQLMALSKNRDPKSWAAFQLYGSAM